LNIFTTSFDVLPCEPFGFTCQTMRNCGNGALTGSENTAPGAALSIPVRTMCANSWSDIPGKAFRILTLVRPSDVAIAKSGCNAKVVGEPVHAAGPISVTTTNATIGRRGRFVPTMRADARIRALTEVINLTGIDITQPLSRCCAKADGRRVTVALQPSAVSRLARSACSCRCRYSRGSLVRRCPGGWWFPLSQGCRSRRPTLLE
jgi:hypothetical protein